MDSKPHAEPPWLLTLKAPEESLPPPREPPDKPAVPSSLPDDTLGLALSGADIGGMAFCLGILQSMARAGWLRHVDFLSTVGAGSGIGGLLGRIFDVYRRTRCRGDSAPGQPMPDAQAHAARELLDARSFTLHWLRNHVNGLAPSGFAAALGAFARVLFVYAYFGWALVALFGLLNAIHYGTVPKAWESLTFGFMASLTPISPYAPMSMAGPWLNVAELVFWLTTAPLLISFVTVSDESPGAFIAPVLITVSAVAGVLLVVLQTPLPLMVFAAAIFWAMLAWMPGSGARVTANAGGSLGRMLVRDRVSRWLAHWFLVTAVLTGIAGIDGFGRWWATSVVAYGFAADVVVGWLGLLLLVLVGSAALVTLGRRLASLLSVESPWRGPLFLACLILGALPLLSVCAFISHIAYQGGQAFGLGLGFTALAVVISVLLGRRECVGLYNKLGSAARGANALARVILAAVNPLRRHAGERDLTQAIAGDDIPHGQYHPEFAGGPLHLINCALNETIEPSSPDIPRGRPTENLAVGPAGVSVAQVWHALWTEDSAPDAQELKAIAPDGGPHPLLGTMDAPVKVEAVDLRMWLSISGTVAPAEYWWDSGLTAEQRVGMPVRRGLWPRVRRLLTATFHTHALLWTTLTRRFTGRWDSHWCLSAGTEFEPTGAYELLRRRVPFVIICDGGGHAGQPGSSLAKLLERVGVDFGIEVQAYDSVPKDLSKAGVPDHVLPHLGTLENENRAVLLLLRHPCGQDVPGSDPWLARKYTWLLYIKAQRAGDEPATMPDLPADAQWDRVHGEFLWESCRKLGERIGAGVFPSTTAT